MAEKNLRLLYAELISRCWEDEKLKKRFMEDTFNVLMEFGIPVEEGVEYKVIEAAQEENYIVLPATNVAETVREISKLLLSVSEQTDVIVPEGTKIVVLQNTDKINYIIFKQAPQIMSEVELDMVAGGKGKNAAVSINYGVAVNVAIAATVNTAALATVVAGGAVAVGGAAIVALAAVVFI